MGNKSSNNQNPLPINCECDDLEKKIYQKTMLYCSFSNDLKKIYGENLQNEEFIEKNVHQYVIIKYRCKNCKKKNYITIEYGKHGLFSYKGKVQHSHSTELYNDTRIRIKNVKELEEKITQLENDKYSASTFNLERNGPTKFAKELYNSI